MEVIDLKYTDGSRDEVYALIRRVGTANARRAELEIVLGAVTFAFPFQTRIVENVLSTS